MVPKNQPMFQYEQNVQINAGKKGENDSSENKHKCSSNLFQPIQIQHHAGFAQAAIFIGMLLLFCRSHQVQVVYSSGFFTLSAFIADQEAQCEKINTSSTALVLTFTRSCAKAQPNAMAVYLSVNLW